MEIDRKMIEETFIKPPQSFWLDSTPTTNYPSLEEDIKVDAAIIGGGMAGISCAYFLKKEGLKVAVLEGDHVLTGTTGHTTAKITSQHHLIYAKIKNQMGKELARQYGEANETATRMIETIIREHHIDCDFVPQPAFIYTQQDQYVEQIQDEVDAASGIGIEASYVEDIPFPSIPIKAGIRFDGQAQFHPRKYLLPLAESIPGGGSHIFEQSRVVDIDGGKPYVIITDQGKRVTAEKLIIASHYPCYNKAGLYMTRIYQDRSYVIAIKSLDQFPGGMYISAEDPARSLRAQRTDLGELILVGGESHKTGQGVDTQGHYGALIQFAGDHFQVEGIPYRWSAQDCMTLDGIPYIGQFTSKTPNMYLATGFAKWGMTNSTVAAMLLRDLIITGKSPWQDVYHPSRGTITSSAKNFIVENFDVAKHFIGGKTAPLPQDVEIEAGEGKIIEKNGQRTGAYRDEEGVLHLVDTTCTHLGCELNWNSAEKSWDCPCHGSRFSYQGAIIDGPTVKPLEPLEPQEP
ncbi:FAD-dependent oxidoreductase [Dehalobacterium formicoaceticum]|uniref:FAD-dependent oxidoreductase n=1 Tax=Dehalobacterium formicoaceticum TaxID=51515 RepID=A0ABT1Y1K4_9FIRM|nr:FAD-dependent oxidoreductase [Dehalobacterium formicoaceticum]MCR6544396.1 FAD-dependent oxidoreductase [Dehalobacterium formicoaceticum]